MLKMMASPRPVEPSSHLVHCSLFVTLGYEACYHEVKLVHIYSYIVSRDRNMLVEQAGSLELFGIWFRIWLRAGTTLRLAIRKDK